METYSTNLMDIDAIYQRGFEFRCSGAYGQAKVEFLKVIAVDPNHVKAQHQLGLIQGFEGDFDGSLEILNKLCLANPNDNEIRYDLAMTQMMLGMSDEACQNFKMILQNDPSHKNALQQSVYC